MARIDPATYGVLSQAFFPERFGGGGRRGGGAEGRGVRPNRFWCVLVLRGGSQKELTGGICRT